MADTKDRAIAAPTVSKEANLSKSQATLKALEAQPKVTIMLEKREGEYPVLEFNVNGVKYEVERGKPTVVPNQIAQMLYDKLASENKVAQLSKEMVDKLTAARLI